MSTTEIKDRITKMTAEERDDILLHILAMQESDDTELSDEWKKELDARKKAYESGEMKGKPYEAFIKELGLH